MNITRKTMRSAERSEEAAAEVAADGGSWFAAGAGDGSSSDIIDLSCFSLLLNYARRP
jgi:hypothetical protein